MSEQAQQPTSIRAMYFAQNTRVKLDFGIHDNVVIRSVDIAPRKKDDGSFAPQHMHITFTKLDVAGNPIAEREFGLFAAKHDSKYGIGQGAMNELNKLVSILKPYMPEAKIDEYINPFTSLGITAINQMDDVLSVKANMDKFNQILREGFMRAVTPMMGLESPYRFRFKVTYDKTGKYVEFGKTDFIESLAVPKEESALVINNYDLRVKSEATKAIHADGAPAGVPAGSGMPAPPIPSMAGRAPSIPGMPGAAAATPFAAPAAPAAVAPVPAAVPAPAPVMKVPAQAPVEYPVPAESLLGAVPTV